MMRDILQSIANRMIVTDDLAVADDILKYIATLPAPMRNWPR